MNTEAIAALARIEAKIEQARRALCLAPGDTAWDAYWGFIDGEYHRDLYTLRDAVKGETKEAA